MSMLQCTHRCFIPWEETHSRAQTSCSGVGFGKKICTVVHVFFQYADDTAKEW